jgi:hypothetical protein
MYYVISKYAKDDGLIDEGWETDSINSFRQPVCIMSVPILYSFFFSLVQGGLAGY